MTEGDSDADAGAESDAIAGAIRQFLTDGGALALDRCVQKYEILAGFMELAGGILLILDSEDSRSVRTIVVDEAHEIFAGVYKRFDKEGTYTATAMTATYSACSKKAPS